MSSRRRGLAVQLIVVVVAMTALAPAAASWAPQARPVESPDACSMKDFGHYVVRPALTPLGIIMPITISAENVSRKTCTVGCRDNPVGVRILDSRKRVVTDLGVLAAAGCPPDPSSPDGVVRWPIKPGQTDDQSRSWNQGICANGTCTPVVPGTYTVEVRWTRSDGNVTKTAKISIKRQPPCPKSPGDEQLAPWCTRAETTSPLIPTTTRRRFSPTG